MLSDPSFAVRFRLPLVFAPIGLRCPCCSLLLTHNLFETVVDLGDLTNSGREANQSFFRQFLARPHDRVLIVPREQIYIRGVRSRGRRRRRSKSGGAQAGSLRASPAVRRYFFRAQAVSRSSHAVISTLSAMICKRSASSRAPSK
jgi:hypothetical protein